MNKPTTQWKTQEEYRALLEADARGKEPLEPEYDELFWERVKARLMKHPDGLTTYDVTVQVLGVPKAGKRIEREVKQKRNEQRIVGHMRSFANAGLVSGCFGKGDVTRWTPTKGASR